MKTTKSFSRRIDSAIEKLQSIQEDIEKAIAEYDEKESEKGSLTEKQEEQRDELQEEYDEIQNAIDYIEMFSSEKV